MKIIEKINQLAVEEELRTGVAGSQIIFKKFKSPIGKHLNMQVTFLNTSVILENVENGINDNHLEQVLVELKKKHFEQIEMCFYNLNRYNCGGKFDI